MYFSIDSSPSFLESTGAVFMLHSKIRFFEIVYRSTHTDEAISLVSQHNYLVTRRTSQAVPRTTLVLFAQDSYLRSRRFSGSHDHPSKEICQSFEKRSEHPHYANITRANRNTLRRHLCSGFVFYSIFFLLHVSLSRRYPYYTHTQKNARAKYYTAMTAICSWLKI